MEKINKVLVFTFGFILLILINVFLSIFHLFMRKKSETHQRLLNILYTVLAFTIQVSKYLITRISGRSRSLNSRPCGQLSWEIGPGIQGHVL